MRALAQSQGQEGSHSSLKYFKVSMTVVVGGIDMNIAFLVKLRKFIEEECMVGLCYVERVVH
jgi:hypothetical protein